MASVFRRYRWKELGLFIIPFTILLLEVTQLFLANEDPKSSLSTQSLPTIHGLIPVFGLIGVLLAVNIILSVFFPKADQILLPLVGLLSGIGVVMALRIGPNLRPADPTLGTHQLVWDILGLVVFLATIFVLRN